MATKPPRRNRRVSCGTSVDLSVALRELGESLEFNIHEGDYGRPGEYHGTARCPDTPAGKAIVYLFREIMSKFDDGDKTSEAAKTSGALAKFHEAEELCKDTNRRFDRYFYGHRPEDPDVARTILRAREKIWRLLGKVDLDLLARDFTFTTGGSAMLPRRSGSAIHKYSTKVETTSGSELLLRSVLQTIPSWDAYVAEVSGINVIHGNKLTCVPKNYKVHRLIAGEPTGNMYIQKGIHASLRRKLKQVGVNLDDQRVNQDLALLGSKTGMLATVDMSMASDTVSNSVVEWFVPEDWYMLMNFSRSPVGKFASGEMVLYRKFSSMGNAFTFELESLIFWALAEASCEFTGSSGVLVGVYGDDVVIPTRSCNLFLRVLTECGFKPNERKTFVQGLFRESCGKHYFRGLDISPFYIKRPIKRLPDLFLLVNNLERWRRRFTELPDVPSGYDKALKALIHKLRGYAPSSWSRPRIPDGFGDGAFIGTFDECLPSRPRGKRLWFEGWQIEVLSEKRDIALGIDDCPLTGHRRPILRRNGRIKVGTRTNCLDGVTLVGFLLSKLERADRKSVPWHVVHSRTSCLRLLAVTAQDIPETPGEGLVLNENPTWEVTTIIVPQF